jgi:hypothetical protein
MARDYFDKEKGVWICGRCGGNGGSGNTNACNCAAISTQAALDELDLALRRGDHADSKRYALILRERMESGERLPAGMIRKEVEDTVADVLSPNPATVRYFGGKAPSQVTSKPLSTEGKLLRALADLLSVALDTARQLEEESEGAKECGCWSGEQKQAVETARLLTADHWHESGEGPFASEREAYLFCKAEVGAPWRIEEKPDGWHVLVYRD